MVDGPERGRLATRPPPAGRHRVEKAVEKAAPGSRELALGSSARAWLRVPSASPDPGAQPLLVALHGAGGRADGMLTMVADAADRHGVLVLAPQSTLSSWDMIRGGFGPDVRLVDQALSHVLDEHDVDPDRIAVCGFSDGASYAASLGIANGDLFGHVMAWSPGFASAEVAHGRARFYISHGTRDRVLPVDRCSRRLVPRLRSFGYDVVYEEFDGPHTAPPEVVDRSVRWLLESRRED